jgi:REP element-mobilizing transposase RayT
MHAKLPGHAALRRHRSAIVGQIYLLTSCTDQRRPYFADFWTGRIVVHVTQELDAKEQSETLALVVMPDHVHWLIELKQSSLASLMRGLKSESARRLNLAKGHTGPIWQRGYHDRAIRTDEELRAVARYVVRNPVRAGLVLRVGDYPLWDAIWL